MNTKVMLVSAILLGASVVVAPVQAHQNHNDLWPLHGLTGLILYDAYSSHHHHHKHRYYDGDRGHYNYRYRRHHSDGFKHRSRDKHSYKRKYR